MAHVLILSLVFPPDNVSTAHLMGDVCIGFLEAGHSVTVLTTEPHVNRDLLAEATQPIRRVVPGVVSKSAFRGADVYHSATLKRTTSRARRIASWGLFHLVTTTIGLMLRSKVDVIIGPSPPITIGLGAWILAIRHRAPFVYGVLELFPDIAVHLEQIRNKPLVALLHKLERFIYKKAAFVTASTPAIMTAIRQRGVDADKALDLPNWVDTDSIAPQRKRNPFSDEFGLSDRFTVSYVGNIGLAQSFGDLLMAAKNLEAVPDIRFLVVGDGVARQDLEQQAIEMNLANVTFVPFQPRDTVSMIYAASDVLFVSLHASVDSDALPSKVYEVMAAGRPILAVTGPNSDLARLVREGGCGSVVSPGRSNELTEVIMKLARSDETISRMGAAGRAYAEAHFSKDVVLPRLISHVEALLDTPPETR